MTKQSDPSSKQPSDEERKDGTPTGDKFDLSGDFRGATVNIKSTIGAVDNNVRLQNLRDFTVQIRNDADRIVGTGIAVSMDGKIVTCAHVVRAAGIEPRNSDGTEVGIYFPQARGGEEKKRRAKVDRCFREHDDDMVLLQLTGGASPLAPEQIAALGMADKSEGNPFRTYGYSPIETYPAMRGDGLILGTVEPPVDRNLQADPIQLKSRDIAAGMSGAAVLDVTRNLVVGLVAERYYPKSAVQDDIGFGVDTKVLTFSPFDFVVSQNDLALKPAPEFRLDKDLFKQAMDIATYMLAHRPAADKFSWNTALSVLPEWTGRDELLAHLSADWNDPSKHVTGLIGFGGEGKSSLARKWVENVIQSKIESQKSSSDIRPLTCDGVFWWGFYENRSVDEFLEAALNYLSGGKIDPRQVPSSSLRAQIIGAMLGAGRYLFVLDGLEVMQHQDGDQYGLLTSNDLRDLLTYFARPDNQSFCLITSRAPLLDLMEYTTYQHRDVDRLSEADGIALLKKLGVKPSPVIGRGQGEGNAQLAKIVSDWDGHALTISLLGSYLAEKHNGDLAHLADIPIPTADEPRYERVHRVLRRYDEHLTDAECEFLRLFSAFRTPVHEDAFSKVFQPLLSSFFFPGNERGKKKEGFFARLFKPQSPNVPTPDSRISNIVSRLVDYRILRHDAASQTYTAHPLVRNHYLAHLTHDTGSPDTHLKIKDYYLSIAGDTPQFPTLDDLKPLIEVVHHACQAGAHDEAFQIYWERILQREKRILVHQLGAHDTDLNVMLEFLPDRDKVAEPQTSKSDYYRFILNEIGYCLMSLGHLRDAAPFYERYVKGNIEAQDWSNASVGNLNLADLHTHLGALEASAEAARQALDLARKAENKQKECWNLVRYGWSEYLQGNFQLATSSFSQAETLEKELSQSKYLYSITGIMHANQLRRTGDLDYSRRVIEANLQICEQYRFIKDISMCHRVLGDLDFDPSTSSGQAHNPESARAHYESALKIARSISVRHVLIEALLARGRFYAKANLLGLGDLTGFDDLNEALNYAVEGGYRIYEADIRVALGWAWLASALTPGPSPKEGRGESLAKARAEAERALQMSQEMGYHWGKVDAEEVLRKIRE